MEFDAGKLAAAAIEARQMSYSPYSHFAVGAALLAEDGRMFTGCNVESAAYSPTSCAERTALVKGVSEGVRRFVAVAVAGGPTALGTAEELPLCTPCGVCRQMLFEFCTPDTPVVLARSYTQYEVHTLGELLPMGFGPADLDHR